MAKKFRYDRDGRWRKRKRKKANRAGAGGRTRRSGKPRIFSDRAALVAHPPRPPRRERVGVISNVEITWSSKSRESAHRPTDAYPCFLLRFCSSKLIRSAVVQMDG